MKIGRMRIKREKQRRGFWVGQWVNDNGLQYGFHGPLLRVVWRLWCNRWRRHNNVLSRRKEVKDD